MQQIALEATQKYIDIGSFHSVSGWDADWPPKTKKIHIEIHVRLLIFGVHTSFF